MAVFGTTSNLICCTNLLLLCMRFTSIAAGNHENSARCSTDSNKLSPFYRCLCTRFAAKGLRGSALVLPGDSEYPVATLTYNLAIQHQASAIVYPSSSEDVSGALKCAYEFRVPVVGRGGGHSYGSFSSGDHSLVIDVSMLQKIQSDALHSGEAGELVTVGSGLRLGDLSMRLSKMGRAVGLGTCPLVGLAGQSLCGGFGMASRKWGLLLDHIEEMEVVTGNGTQVKTSPVQNADLFFAMRGAGPSFGIMTALTLKTHAAPTEVTKFELRYNFSNAEIAAQALQHFQYWAVSSAPPELGMRWTIDQPHQERYDATSSRIHWKLGGMYYGARIQCEKVIKSLNDGFTTPAIINMTTLDWMGSVEQLAGNQPLSSVGKNPSNSNTTFYAKSLIIGDPDKNSASAWLKFTNAVYASVKLSDRPENAGNWWFIEIDLYGGKFNGMLTGVQASGNAMSSFGPREGLLLVQFGGGSPSGARLDQGSGMRYLVHLLESFYTSLGGGKREMSGYPCYADTQFSAARAHWEYFGEKLTKRLEEIKLKWDPQRVFQYPQGF